MKLELSVSKKNISRHSGHNQEIVFAVIDLDKAEDYPLNFVCLLPKNLKRDNNPSNKFLEIYGKESSQIATKLLTKELKKENETEVKTEIKKRLKFLEPKSVNKVKCRLCGCLFQLKFKNYQQKICPRCRNKKQTAQQNFISRR